MSSDEVLSGSRGPVVAREGLAYLNVGRSTGKYDSCGLAHAAGLEFTQKMAARSDHLF